MLQTLLLQSRNDYNYILYHFNTDFYSSNIAFENLQLSKHLKLKNIKNCI